MTDGLANAKLSQPELPPYLREQLARYEQIQQNLQAVLMQKRRVELERDEAKKALEELGKASESGGIYRFAGSLLIKVSKDAMVKELNKKKEAGGHRVYGARKAGDAFQRESEGAPVKNRRRGKGRLPRFRMTEK